MPLEESSLSLSESSRSSAGGSHCRSQSASGLRTPGGRFYLDTDWPAWGVRTEIHGIPHSRIARWDEDLMRQNEIAIHGAGLLVFSSYATRHLGERVARQLQRMFESHGWRQRAAA